MTESPPHDYDASSTRVLLVDEDHEVRSQAARLLEDAGCVVIEADSGHDALSKLQVAEGEIDALVTALDMTDMDGIVLANHAQAVASPIATVLVTPDPFMVGDRTRRSIEAEVVPRLFVLEQLIAALSTAVARRRTRV